MLNLGENILMPAYLGLGFFMFTVGVVGVIVRRNPIVIFMCIELMLNAVNINLVAFWRYLTPANSSGQMFTIIVLTVAAAEAAVGLALIISIYRRRNTVIAEEIDLMKW